LSTGDIKIARQLLGAFAFNARHEHLLEETTAVDEPVDTSAVFFVTDAMKRFRPRDVFCHDVPPSMRLGQRLVWALVASLILLRAPFQHHRTHQLFAPDGAAARRLLNVSCGRYARPGRGAPMPIYRRLATTMAGGVGSWGGMIVINLNFDRLFFMLTAAFFAYAVVRTLGLLFS
jgi:hypothetical protein